jgi:hypothetical protein
VFWRVTGFGPTHVEALQKQLARELGTDPAATPVTQATRLAGFLNCKYSPATLVTIDYHLTDRAFMSTDFPPVEVPVRMPTTPLRPVRAGMSHNAVDRARRYLERVPPAIAGQHGDLHTFRVCCRLVRGFALDDEEALDVLANWNACCLPPWTERELRDKIWRAKRYGREPIAGLLTRS